MKLRQADDGAGIREQRVQAASWSHLVQKITSHPVEAGKDHPAESDLDEYLRRFGSVGLADAALKAGADVVMLLGRSRRVPPDERVLLLTGALQSGDVRVRDAAVTAVDHWQDAPLLEILRGHVDSVLWLHEYIQRVVAA